MNMLFSIIKLYNICITFLFFTALVYITIEDTDVMCIFSLNFSNLEGSFHINVHIIDGVLDSIYLNWKDSISRIFIWAVTQHLDFHVWK